MKAFSGVLTAIATPFDHNNDVDKSSFEKILSHLKSSGTHGVVVAGTTGESPTLSSAERLMLYTMALEFQSDDFKIYAGTGSNCTRETIETTRHAVEARLGDRRLDGAMIVVPYYNRPSQEGIKAHFGEVFRSFPKTNFCLYNVPGRTGTTLSPSTALELFELHSNCIAIKEAAGNVGVIAEIALGLKKRKLVRELLSGDDATFAPALVSGATGIISVSTHIIPRSMVAMWKAWQNNDLNELQRRHLDCLAINTDLFCTANPIGLKWMLAELGLCKNVFRLPMTPADDVSVGKLSAAFETLKTHRLED